MQETWVRSLSKKIPWRRKWLSTPVFLPGEFHGLRSLVDYSPWGRKESDMTEQLNNNNNPKLSLHRSPTPPPPYSCLFWELWWALFQVLYTHTFLTACETGVTGTWNWKGKEAEESISSSSLCIMLKWVFFLFWQSPSFLLPLPVYHFRSKVTVIQHFPKLFLGTLLVLDIKQRLLGQISFRNTISNTSLLEIEKAF